MTQEPQPVEPLTPVQVVRHLLDASSIVIVGASDDPRKASGRTLHYLSKYKYAGAVYPVNPRRETVQGIPAYRSVADVPGRPDLAVIVVPAADVADAVRDVGARGIPVAVVFASGFAETGDDGERAQQELAAVARKAGVRILGPNCVGVVGAGRNLTAAFMTGLDQDRFDLVDDGLAFVTQSGAMGAFILSMAQSSGLGLGRFVSTGNEADLTLPQIIEGLVDDDTTTAVLGYVEGIRDPEGFRRALSHAAERRIPVALMKVGRSARGALAAQSHTGSLVGSDAVYAGLFSQYGVHRADDIDQLLDLGRVFASPRRAGGPRLSIVTLSGGAGVLLTDAAEDAGLTVAPWTADWQQRIAAVLPPFASVTNPIDTTGAIAGDQNMLRDAAVLALENPDSDIVIVMIGNLDREEERVSELLIEAAATADKPLVVVWVGGSGRPVATLSRAGVPTFTEPLRAIRAVAALVDWSAAHGAGTGRVHSRLSPRHEEAESPAALDEVAAKALLSRFGVSTVREVAVTTPREAADAARFTGLPAVVKLLSRNVTHKSEHGFVRLGLDTEAEVSAATEQILAAARAIGIEDRRIVVQAMLSSETELILGMRHDPAFGPAIALGLGGVLTEIAADVAVRLPPLTANDVASMRAALRNSALLDGPRGRVAVDHDALTRTVLAFARFAEERGSEFDSVEINPLLVDADGSLVAVDALMIPSSPGGPTQERA
jgi:acyl-CoA synthetase (NDP forming)